MSNCNMDINVDKKINLKYGLAIYISKPELKVGGS